MAQKDYVSRSRKSSQSRNNKRTSLSSKKPLWIIAVIVLFIAGLYVLTHHKPPSPPSTSLSNSKSEANALPPKPEERWSYIKELEGMQNGTSTSPVPHSGSSSTQTKTPASLPAPLNNEQRQILQEMQAEQPQTPVNPPQPKTTAVPPPSVQTPVRQPSPEKKGMPATPASPKKNSRWLLQCGSFQQANQAESVRAKLAFAGIESRVQQEKGRSRVILGPYHQRQQALDLQKKIVNNAQTHCIVLIAEG